MHLNAKYQGDTLYNPNGEENLEKSAQHQAVELIYTGMLHSGSTSKTICRAI